MLLTTDVTTATTVGPRRPPRIYRSYRYGPYLRGPSMKNNSRRFNHTDRPYRRPLSAEAQTFGVAGSESPGSQTDLETS